MDITTPTATPQASVDTTQPKQSSFLIYKRKLQNKNLTPYALGIIVLAVIGVGFLYFHQRSVTYDPVPLNVRTAVPFNIYVPDPAKLPAGYSLDTQSFSTGNDAVVYKIHGLNGQAIIVTVQQKPSNDAIQAFYKAHMPLSIPISTNVGSAALGALNSETVVSLPTSTNAWLLMTAPSDVNQAQLKQVTQAMMLAQ